MPTYEFYCEKCKKAFSVVISISDYDKKKYNCPKCKGKKVKLDPIDGVIKLHILVDRTSIEVFPNYGQVTLHLCFPLDTENTLQYLSAEGGKANIKSLKLYRLKSIWPKA